MITLRRGTVEEVVSLSREVPELKNPYPEEVYRQKLDGKPFLILLAEVEGVPAGFKVGYERDGFWYSWMGGVLPDFRRRGLASRLADAQDDWARRQGYDSVTFKTLNRHRNMLRFAIDRGFNIIRVDLRADSAENRIWLSRPL